MRLLGLWVRAAVGVVLLVSGVFQMATNSIPLWWWVFVPFAALALLVYIGEAVQAGRPRQGSEPGPPLED